MPGPIEEQVSIRAGDNFSLSRGGSDLEKQVTEKLFADTNQAGLPLLRDGSHGSGWKDMEGLNFPDEARDKKFYERANTENAAKYLNRALQDHSSGLSKGNIDDALKNKNMTMDERRAYQYMRDNFDKLSTGWVGVTYFPFNSFITLESFRTATQDTIHKR